MKKKSNRIIEGVNKKTSLSIRNKLILFFSLILIVSLFIPTTIIYFQISAILNENTKENLISVSKYSSKEVELWLNSAVQQLEVLASSPSIQNDNSKLIGKYLGDVVKKNTSFESVMYARKNGLAITSNEGKTLVVKDELFFKETLDKKDIYISEMSYSKISDKACIFISVPVLNADKLGGIIVASVTIEELEKRILEISTERAGFAYLVQGDGLYVVHPDKEKAKIYNPLVDEEKDSVIVDITQSMINRESKVN